MKVVNIAWPDLGEVDDPGGPPGEYEGQRHECDDGARSHAAEDVVDEFRHGRPPLGRPAASSPRYAWRNSSCEAMSAPVPDITTVPRLSTTRVPGDTQCGDGVLLDQQHRDIGLRRQALHHLEDLGDDERGQSQRRLVEQQALRRAHQGPADRELLSLAAAERVGAHLAPLAEHREQVVELRLAALALGAAQPHAAQAQVLVDGELRDGGPALRDQGHAHPDDFLGLAPGQDVAVERGGAGGRLHQPGTGCA